MNNSQALMIILSIRCNGDWDRIFEAISNHTQIIRPNEEGDALVSIAKSYLSQMGCKAITILDENYPLILKQSYKPPFVLFYKGNINLLKSNNIIAIAGSRNPTVNLEPVKQLIIDMAKSEKDYVTLSGLSLGVATNVHSYSLKYNVPTIAIIGCGINYIYPQSNDLLFQDIAKYGLLLSTYPGHTSPDSKYFPVRNRIIAGLCSKLVIPECTNNSGTQLLIASTLGENKPIYVMPTSLSRTELINNRLIKEGAYIFTELTDIENE